MLLATNVFTFCYINEYSLKSSPTAPGHCVRVKRGVDYIKMIMKTHNYMHIRIHNYNYNYTIWTAFQIINHNKDSCVNTMYVKPKSEVAIYYENQTRQNVTRVLIFTCV